MSLPDVKASRKKLQRYQEVINDSMAVDGVKSSGIASQRRGGLKLDAPLPQISEVGYANDHQTKKDSGYDVDDDEEDNQCI